MRGPLNFKKRIKSTLFWLGMVASVYEAVVGSLVSSSIEMPPIVGAISVEHAAVLLHCNRNDPSLSTY